MLPPEHIFSRSLAALVLVAAILGLPGAAIAQEQTNVAVMGFGGATGGQIRQAVVTGLGARDEINIVPISDVRAAEDRLGVRVDDSSGAQKVGQERRIAGFVDGSAGRRGRAWIASVRLRSGVSGEILQSTSFRDRTLGGLERKVRFGVWRAFRGPLLESAAQGFSGAEDDETEESEESDESGESDENVETEGDQWGDEWNDEWGDAGGGKKSGRKDAAADDSANDEEWDEEHEGLHDDTSADADLLPTFRGSVGIIGQFRSMSFSHQGGDLSPSEFATLGLGYRVLYHPLEFLGVVSKGSFIFPISSEEDSTDLSYPTSSGHFLLAAHLRFEVEEYVVGITAGYEHRETTLGTSGPAGPNTLAAAPAPSVSYNALRLGGDFSLALSSTTLELHGAVLIPFGVGNIDSPVWMRDAGGFGFNLGGEIVVPIDGAWGFVAGVDLDAFFLSAGSSNMNDPFIDASSSDLYLSAYLGAAFTF